MKIPAFFTDLCSIKLCFKPKKKQMLKIGFKFLSWTCNEEVKREKGQREIRLFFRLPDPKQSRRTVIH